MTKLIFTGTTKYGIYETESEAVRELAYLAALGVAAHLEPAVAPADAALVAWLAEVR